MKKPTKPVLYNGFLVRDGLLVKTREEHVYFTEVYSLSNGSYLYLFTNIRHDEVADRSGKYDSVILHAEGKEYLCVIVNDHSHSKITDIIDDLTVLRGFDCVAGMDELKALLINEVIDPLLNPGKFKKFKLTIPNGILLYGPAGCGKTFIVRKLAEELGYNFIELIPSSVATHFIHGAVGNIAKVFQMAKSQAPSIVFIDEIEGLVPKREELSSYADIKKEEINEFLVHLNNASENKILVVGATNRPHMIDSAILRSGRIDKRIYVPAPDFQARKELFRICLSGRPYDPDINFERLARMTENFVSSDIELIVTQAARLAVADDRDIIDEALLIDSINKSKPSISLDEIKYYEQFAYMERW